MNNRRPTWREQRDEDHVRRRRLNHVPQNIRWPNYRGWMNAASITITFGHPEGLTPDQQYDRHYQAQQVAMRSRAYRWLLHGTTAED